MMKFRKFSTPHKTKPSEQIKFITSSSNKNIIKIITEILWSSELSQQFDNL